MARIPTNTNKPKNEREKNWFPSDVPITEQHSEPIQCESLILCHSLNIYIEKWLFGFGGFRLKLHSKHENISIRNCHTFQHFCFNRCEHWWILHFNCKYLDRPKTIYRPMKPKTNTTSKLKWVYIYLYIFIVVITLNEGSDG